MQADDSVASMLSQYLENRHTGTQPPYFSELTEAELEELLFILEDMKMPLFGGLLNTGDDVPAWPYVFGGIGLLALVLLAVMRFGWYRRRS